MSSSSSSSSMSNDVCRHFSLDEIKDATNNFDVSNVLGHGGEGVVYLGHIEEKYPVAVKRLNPNSIEFEKEIKTVSKIQHPNLVSLLGYCNEFNQRILVYEYMQRGSLSGYVKKNSSICLSWKQRLNVCLGAARGLQYLHTATDELPKGIIHRDMKPANILLDENWVPKVSDFGMFKLSHAGQTNSAMMTALKGTCGYYAPEYLRSSQITRKIDVYAFGVVLFEVLCRKTPWDRGDQSYYFREDEDLGLWAKENVDTEINGEISDDSLEVFVDIIGRSLLLNPADRPTMDEVVLDLERALKCHEREDNEGIRPKAPSVRKMIQNIKKIRGNNEDEIYAMLIECSMDPHKTIQKLPFPARKENGTTTQLVEPSNTSLLDVDTGMTQVNVDALIKSITYDLRFSLGKPVAALTIYKCLIHWKSFEYDGTIVFDRLDQMIGSAVEDAADDESMAYWLGNTSTLLFLLQGSFPSASIPRILIQGSFPSASKSRKSLSPPSLFQRTTQVGSSFLTQLSGSLFQRKSRLQTSVFDRKAGTILLSPSPSSANLPVSVPGVVREVEPQYPEFLFMAKLRAHVKKIYSIIRDNLKKDFAPLISCLQVPEKPRASHFRLPFLWSYHLRTIISSLNSLLSTLKENYVPSILVQGIFSQNFSYFNVQIFNSFLLYRECCSFHHGEYMKQVLAKLERWCRECTEVYAGSLWDELKHVRQAVGFLVIREKYRISYDEIANDLCPVLSVQQLHTICTQYWYDDPTRNVASDVISTMRMLMTEDSNNAVNQLDDDSSISFPFDEFGTTLDEKDFSDVKPAGDLVENPAFRFLQD